MGPQNDPFLRSVLNRCRFIFNKRHENPSKKPSTRRHCSEWRQPVSRSYFKIEAHLYLGYHRLWLLFLHTIFVFRFFSSVFSSAVPTELIKVRYCSITFARISFLSVLRLLLRVLIRGHSFDSLSFWARCLFALSRLFFFFSHRIA